MESGVSFLKSQIARRFCLLFLFCAFLPMAVLTLFSYREVASQLESQSAHRLKRDTKAYGLGLFDRLMHTSNVLRYISGLDYRNTTLEHSLQKEQREEEVSTMLLGITFHDGNNDHTLYGKPVDEADLQHILLPERLQQKKPFIAVLPGNNKSRIFMGIQSVVSGVNGWLLGELIPDFLWGIGTTQLLPPLTRLLVFNAEGQLLPIGGEEGIQHMNNLNRQYDPKDPYIFSFKLKNTQFLGSVSHLFLESRFQKTDWIVILAQARSDSMAALEQFRYTFPMLLLFFLLLVLYLSVYFIRSNLRPLEELKKATTRVAKQDFSSTVDISGTDEFAELGKAFNVMTDKIRQQFHAMEMVGEIDRAILSATEKKEIISITLVRLKSFFSCDTICFTVASPQRKVQMYRLEGRRKEDSLLKTTPYQPDIFPDFHPTERIKKLSSDEIPALFYQPEQPVLQNAIILSVDEVPEEYSLLFLGWANPRDLTADEERQARQIADQLAVALANTRLLENHEKLAEGTIEALARTVDAKSIWTSGHSERVAQMAAEIGVRMGLPDTQVKLLLRGGLMHDIGKIGIPVALLDKPGRLTAAEYQQVQTHPSIGAKILEPIAVFKDILTIVEQHHEKFDGSGYPNGKKGNEIDMLARITAVADVWDALVQDRPYRKGWPQEKMLSFFRENSGSHFDPEIINIFFEVFQEKTKYSHSPADQ